MSVNTGIFGHQTIGSSVPSTPLTAMDKQYVADGYTFLQKQLEKFDSKVVEPLSSTSWPRDMPVRTGGGFVESVSNVSVNYATTGADEAALIQEAANDIPAVQADFEKDSVKTFIWGHYLDISYIQQQKLQQIALNLEDVLNKGIHLFYDKTVDKSVYKGFPVHGTTGLINNPSITRKSAAASKASASSTKWEDKTADEILAEINGMLTDVWTANDCADDAIPNHILLPTAKFGDILTRKVGDNGDKSILTYILENNLCKQNGGTLIISPCKWCNGAGTGGTDRMVAYVNQEQHLRFDITVPLRRLQTEISSLMFKTPYVSQFSAVNFIYPTTVEYVDGI